MQTKSLLSDVDGLLEPVVASLGFDLIELEYTNEQGRWILRLYIDSPSGSVTIEDCEKTSRAVSAVMDVEDIIPGRYSLEISSPGIERPLRRIKDFEKFSGCRASVKTNQKINERRNFKGIIKGIRGEVILMECDGSEYEIPVGEILKARLVEDLRMGKMGD